MTASSRDPVTGRFVSTRNMPESCEGKFETYADDLPVGIQGAASPAELAYATERCHAPEDDGLAGRPYPGPLRHAPAQADQRPQRRRDPDARRYPP